MRKLGLMAAASLAGLGMSVLSPRPASTPLPPKKRKTKAKKAKARPRTRDGLNRYSRSIYVPGGAERNCGERGISPKLLERRHARG